MMKLIELFVAVCFLVLHLDNPQFLPLGVNAINIIDSDPQTEFMSFLQVGVKKPSFSTAYLSGVVNKVLEKLMKSPIPNAPSSALNGSHRDCVSCGIVKMFVQLT